MKVCGIVVAAGAGKRLGADQNKVLLPLMGRPLFLYALMALRPLCHHLILVTRADERAAFEALLQEHRLQVDQLVPGGRERRDSVENALTAMPAGCDIVLVQDGARPFLSQDLVRRVIDAARADGAAVPAIPVRDTLRKAENGATATVSREGLYQVQTPQGFQTALLKRAYREHPEAATDDAGLVERLGHPVTLVPGDARNLKITHPEDFTMAQQLLAGSLRLGTGYDIHRLVPGRHLVLGGVLIPHPLGLLGHSDADAPLHALMDALLGACALGDIGQHFPDSDLKYKGASSLQLLAETRGILARHGFLPQQADLTILAQRPRLAPYIPQMRQNIAGALGLPLPRVSVKATTTEGLDAVGREEAIAAQAAVTVLAVDDASFE